MRGLLQSNFVSGCESGQKRVQSNENRPPLRRFDGPDEMLVIRRNGIDATKEVRD